MWCAVLASVIAGCETPDDRLTGFVSQATSQQAQQNHDMAEAARTAAENHRLVVETVEKSRQEIVGLQQDVQRQLQQLDAERRAIADARRRESLLAPVLQHLGVLIIASLPLVLCWYLLHGLSHHDQENQVCDVLIQELMADPTLALPHGTSADRLEHAEPPASPASAPSEP